MDKKLKKSFVSASMVLGILPSAQVVAAPYAANGWVTANGSDYYYRNGSKLMNQWVKDPSGAWCFLDSVNGAKVRQGWAKDSAGWCYIQNFQWVNHAAWAHDSKGWQYIGANGYWDSSVSPKTENPIDLADAAVAKAESEKSAVAVSAAKTLVDALNDAIPEKSGLNLRLSAISADFKVSSVTVLDASSVTIVFSDTVDKNTAENAENYSFGNYPVVTEAELQSDGKTVLVKFKKGDALSNSSDALYTVTVSGVKSIAGIKVEQYQQKFNLFDSEAPVVQSVKALDESTIQVKFSEEIQSVDKNTIVIYDEDGDKVDLTGKIDIDDDDSSIVNIYGLASRNSANYSLSINGVKDLAGNKANLYKKNFSLEADRSDPEVESIKAVKMDKLQITFSEPIDGDFALYVDGEMCDVDISEVSGSSEKSFYAEFDDDYDEDTSYKIGVSDYYDFADNKGDTYTRFIKFHEAVPELKSTKGTIKTFKGSQYAVFTYDQAVDGSIDKDGIAAAKYVKDSDVSVKLSTSEINRIDIYDASDDELKDYLNDDQFAISLKGLKSGDYTIALKKGFAEVGDTESAAVSIKFSVTREENENDGTVYIDGIEKDQDQNDAYYVHFSDSVGQSALDIGNYKVGGENIFSTAEFTTHSKDEVRLIVKPGAIGNGVAKGLSADYRFTATGITDSEGGTVQDFDSHDIIEDAYYGDYDDDNFDGIKFTDTTGPSVKTIYLEASNKIAVVFDEEINNQDHINISDFQVLIDGQAVAIRNADTGNGIRYTLTLSQSIGSSYTQISAGTSQDFDGKDQYGNRGAKSSLKYLKP